MIAWLQITSGRGPEECCWVVARIIKEIINEVSIKAYKSSILESICGITPDIFKSALIAIEGDNISDFVSSWEGTIKWVGQSMFRPNHKRKNWFVGVNALNPPQDKDLKLNEIKIESMKASGSGGQHVNKTESAIRVTHLPTGIVAIAKEERSQHFNRKLALSRLYEKLKQENADIELKQQQDIWSYHNKLERGNPIRTYKGTDFRLKKFKKLENL